MITITQSCDSCQASRQLEHMENSERDGWRRVRENKHLCNTCINDLVK